MFTRKVGTAAVLILALGVLGAGTALRLRALPTVASSVAAGSMEPTHPPPGTSSSPDGPEAGGSGGVVPAGRALDPDGKPEAGAKAATGLAGEWQLVELEQGGKRTLVGAEPTRWFVRGDKIVVSFGEFRQSRLTLRVGPGGPPTPIDLAVINLRGEAAPTSACLAVVADGRLKVAWPDPKAPGTRPTGFGGAGGQRVWVFERYRGKPAEDERAFATVLLDWEMAVEAYFAGLGRKKAEELAKPFGPLAERCLRLAEAHPDTAGGLAALCLAAVNAPATEPGRKALAALQGGRLARAGLGDLRKALDAARRPRLARQPTPLAPLVVERVRRAPDDPQAARLLAWVCADGPVQPPAEVPKAFAEAAELIVARFAGSPDIGDFCLRLGNTNGSPRWAGRYEKALKTILEKNRHPNVRTAALFALATLVEGAGEERQDEAEGLYRRFLAEFGGPGGTPRNSLWAPLAKARLEGIRTLGVGKPAPEIEGEDLDGRPMKLSDFRGKVVLLSFWHTGCVPCMKLIPHERALAARLKDEPFALVGVNSDREPEVLRKAVEKHGISWRSFKNRRPGKKAVSDEWKVTGWPNLYLIDHQGVIRKRWLDAPPADALAREVDRLVEAARAAGPK